MDPNRIQRGQACVPCHTRKKKCDGMRPSCTSCTRSHLQCEYSPVPARQGYVKALTARVEELENRLATMSSDSSSGGSTQGHDAEPSSNAPTSDLSIGAPVPVVDPVSGDIAEWLQTILLDTMIANRHRYSLYLNISTLRSPPRPLLDAMNLVACHILTASAGPGTRPTPQQLECLTSKLLSKVYAGVHTSLENARDLLSGAVCAPALAAQYLLEVGRFAEAHWLAGTAVRFAISSGIQTITSHQWTPGGMGDLSQSPNATPLESSSSFLVPPRDAQEQHDRLMTWWLAYTADGLIEIVGKLPSALRAEILACLGDVEANLGGFRVIPAVFPLPEGMYGDDPYGPDVYSIGILDLLSEHDAPGILSDGSSESVFAMRLKAITFYHAAVSINDSLRNTGRSLDFTISSRIFTRISAFIERLPNLSYRESAGSPHEHTGSINLDVVMAYMLAHTATIHLYSTSILPDDLQNRLGAALAIGQLADALQGEEMRMRSQVLMTCCASAFEILDSGDGNQRAGLEFQALTSFMDRLKA